MAERNLETQRLIRSLLQTSYDVTFVGDRNATLEKVKEQRFDLFLMDLALDSEGTGLALFRAFREERLQASSPIVAVTDASLSKQEVRSYEERGYDAVLRKTVLNCRIGRKPLIVCWSRRTTLQNRTHVAITNQLFSTSFFHFLI